jgi:O-antigen/teichoic acid export membrane protein
MVANAQRIFGTGLTAPELEKAKILLAILIVNMALTFPNSVFICYITAHEQFVFQRLVTLAQNILNPFLTLPLLLLGYGSVAMVLISTFLTVLSFGVNIYFCSKKLKMKFVFKGMEFSLLKEMAVFTFFIFLNQIIDQINWSVDKFLLGRMCGTAAVAVYGIGGQLNALYIQMSTAVSNVFVPKVNQIVAHSNDNKELTELMTKVGRVQLIILALIMSGFVVFGKPFIRLWAGQAYEESYSVALFLMLPVTIPLIQNLGIEIQRAKNRHQARSIVYSGLAMMNVAISIFFVRKWGSIGAAAGTAISLILGNGLFMNWYYHKRLGLNMIVFWKEMIKLVPALLLAGICGMVYVSIVTITDWIGLVLAIVSYTGLYCVSMWFAGLNAYEKQLLADAFHGVVRRVRT